MDKVGRVDKVGCWAALIGLFFNSRLNCPLFFFFLEVYDVYDKVYVCIWHRLANRLETPRLA